MLAIAIALDMYGVDLVVLDQAIDTATPAGRLVFNLLGAVGEFERDLIIERVRAGMRHAQKHGTRSGKAIGRAPRAVDLKEVQRRRDDGQSWRHISMSMKVPMRTIHRRYTMN